MSIIEIPLFTVDSFTHIPFTGNPAAVCLPGKCSLSETTMQQMAMEMNISETCFIELPDINCDSYKDSCKFKLRWFTPTNEISLCGHATLASAAVLFFKCGNANAVITFTTMSGDLLCKRDEDNIKMDLPRNAPRSLTSDDYKIMDFTVLYKALFGDNYKEFVENTVVTSKECTMKKLLIQLKNSCSSKDLMNLKPDIGMVFRCHDGSLFKGVIVTVRGDPDSQYDFLSRYFAPWNGIDEDPVTGSAHTVLTPYWSNLLAKESMKARQCSKRGGDINVALGKTRVQVAGRALVVLSGMITIPIN